MSKDRLILPTLILIEGRKCVLHIVIHDNRKLNENICEKLSKIRWVESYSNNLADPIKRFQLKVTYVIHSLRRNLGH